MSTKTKTELNKKKTVLDFIKMPTTDTYWLENYLKCRLHTFHTLLSPVRDSI